MDWELKASAWDFTDDPRLAALVGSNSLGPNNNREDFSIDLKLGRLEDMRDDNNVKLQKCSSLGSSKRARAVSGPQNVTCLVDGCTADLNECREYHRRHRVCQRHSKTPVVFVGCKEQRFCQQCSRFHSLAEFDDEKRSCRKRLDGHNRRRRKPQPEAFYINHGNFLSNHQGTRLLQFGGPDAYTSTVSTWPSVPKHHSATFSNSIPTVQNGADKCFPFLLINEPERSNNHHHANVNSHRAHSLLSLPSSSHQRLGPIGSQFGYLPQRYPRSPPMVPQANNYHNNYSGNEMATMSLSPDNLLEKGASQVLPFSWK